jgi:hypothetical protein
MVLLRPPYAGGVRVVSQKTLVSFTDLSKMQTLTLLKSQKTFGYKTTVIPSHESHKLRVFRDKSLLLPELCPTFRLKRCASPATGSRSAADAVRSRRGWYVRPRHLAQGIEADALGHDDVAAGATTPRSSSMPSSSRWTHSSAIFPSRMRKMAITDHRTVLPPTA